MLSMDCEMVGTGLYGYKSILARVSIVDYNGECIFDTFVKPFLEVTDYRTPFSGCTKELLEDAPEFKLVQKQVYDIIKGKIIIGHDLGNDFRALMLKHPHNLVIFLKTILKYLKIEEAGLLSSAKNIFL